MFFSRRPKNRRLARQHVLDVKLRSSQVRKTRLRLLTAGIGSLCFLAFGLYVLWRSADWALARLVYENSAFELQQLDVQTDGIISVNQICRWAGLKPHQNLLALDVSLLKRNLELIPVVQAVSVERILPRTLRIRVIEREPIAQVNVPRARIGGGIETTVFQLDGDGFVMIPLEANQRAHNSIAPEVLPVIAGLDSRELQPGRQLGGQSLQAALKLIIAFQQSPMAGLVDLKWIDISTPQVLTIKTGQANEITLGLFDIEQQLRRWRVVFDLGQKLGKQIATLDLAITNSVPLKWHDPDTLPPSLPQPSKPLRLKKSHV